MQPARLTPALLALALSAGVATASTIEYDEALSGDLAGPADGDSPTPSEILALTLDSLGTLGASQHLLVKGTYGDDPENEIEDLWDLFRFSTTETFEVSLIDFEFVDGNEISQFRIFDDEGELEAGFNQGAGGPNGNLFDREYEAGTYILGGFETGAFRQPYQLRVTTNAAPSEVPVPAAAWLLAGGLAALGAAKAARRRRD